MKEVEASKEYQDLINRIFWDMMCYGFSEVTEEDQKTVIKEYENAIKEEV
jgi:hypothetical protein